MLALLHIAFDWKLHDRKSQAADSLVIESSAILRLLVHFDDSLKSTFGRPRWAVSIISWGLLGVRFIKIVSFSLSQLGWSSRTDAFFVYIVSKTKKFFCKCIQYISLTRSSRTRSQCFQYCGSHVRWPSVIFLHWCRLLYTNNWICTSE